ncbi:hypothetical protein ML462_15810 [Gramella lutea]|uniref:Uncharacterized protein n=1 Tax=Christiangramia lutea TaxID=1607951 RepID=A0A9X1V5J0_9FLAO|nr:hypothetical protein [Christiangramia lutea]MCH4824640.1 hypothetical protein [Christiangramia lutea]
MGRIISYEILNQNLILNEDLYWTFDPTHKESIKVWTFYNFDSKIISKEELDRLIGYKEDVDFEIKKENELIKIRISTFYDDKIYRINCSNYKTELRLYNNEELTKIILLQKEQLKKEQDKIDNYSSLIENLTGYIQNEKSKRKVVLSELNEETSKLAKKEKYKLSFLQKIDEMLSEFK